MSGLAEILIKEGFSISGSDIHTSDIIKHLEDKGAKVYLNQTADNITCLLYTSYSSTIVCAAAFKFLARL